MLFFFFFGNCFANFCCNACRKHLAIISIAGYLLWIKFIIQLRSVSNCLNTVTSQVVMRSRCTLMFICRVVLELQCIDGDFFPKIAYYVSTIQYEYIILYHYLVRLILC